MRYQGGRTMVLPQSVSQHSQKENLICALPDMKQLSCISALGSHITAQEQPGLQDLCPCVRSQHKKESGASWEGISEYFCTAWTSKKGPRICTMPHVVLEEFTAACYIHGIGVG